ncbi:MAG: hypothetical protein P8Z71_09095 [Candidatus Sulfobium sp.]
MTRKIRALEKSGRVSDEGTVFSRLTSERGIALVLVLILSAMALAMMAALVYMLTIGTQASGTQKRYSNALEAGRAGSDMSFDMIAARGNLTLQGIAMTMPTNVDTATGTPCLTEKLNNDTSTWNNCDSTVAINLNDATTYDWSFQLGDAGGGQQFTVYAKIVDTVAGNTGGDAGLSKNGVVSSTGEVPVVARPYLYTMAVDAEGTGIRPERARYSILYQY